MKGIAWPYCWIDGFLCNWQDVTVYFPTELLLITMSVLIVHK